MNKKILVLSGSPRKDGNSEILCDQFIMGAEEAGHQAEKIALKDKSIHYCTGCDCCTKNGGKCIYKDDMAEILDKMIRVDVIVIATPVYFYSMTAQMKTLIDRVYSRYSQIHDKDIYFILTCTAPEKRYMDVAIEGLRGFTVCLPDAEEKGIVFGFGVTEIGAVRDTPAMQEAYKMGASV